MCTWFMPIQNLARFTPGSPSVNCTYKKNINRQMRLQNNYLSQDDYLLPTQNTKVDRPAYTVRQDCIRRNAYTMCPDYSADYRSIE